MYIVHTDKNRENYNFYFGADSNFIYEFIMLMSIVLQIFLEKLQGFSKKNHYKIENINQAFKRHIMNDDFGLIPECRSEFMI